MASDSSSSRSHERKRISLVSETIRNNHHRRALNVVSRIPGLGFVNELLFYVNLLDASNILRRYFIMNGFDGILSALGVIMGTYMARSIEPRIVVFTTLGLAFAMCVSGFIGAFITERAERLRELKELEKMMFTDLDNSVYKKAVDIITVLAAIVDATAPVMFSLLAITPFILAYFELIPAQIAFIASLVTTSLLLLVLGILLARISKENPAKYSLYMLVSGFLIALLGVILGGR